MYVPLIQQNKMHDGSFHLHRVMLPGRPWRYSLYCDKNGILVDAEMTNHPRYPGGRGVSTKGSVWRQLQRKAQHCVVFSALVPQSSL